MAAGWAGESYSDAFGARGGRDPGGNQSFPEFRDDAPGIFRGGTGRQSARPRRPPKGAIAAHHIFILGIAVADARILRPLQRRSKSWKPSQQNSFLRLHLRPRNAASERTPS
jgi:hypothetical protein